MKNYNELIEEIKNQSKTHPDKSLRNFYSAFLSYIEENTEKTAFFEDIYNSREITIKHYTNLIYRGIQYILISKEFDLKKLGKFTKNEWRETIDKIIKDEETLKIYKNILLNERTQTTIYQRYAGPKAALVQIFGTRPIRVIDIGCGLNIGLPGLEHNYNFKPLVDETSNELVSQSLEKELNIVGGYAMDINDPLVKKEWALACGFYPGELENLPTVRNMCEDLWEKTNIKFYKESIFNVDKLFKIENLENVDVVIASTVLYQFDDSDIDKALSKVKKILKPGGIMIINDFVSTNGKLKWNVNWFKGQKKSTYKTVLLTLNGNEFSKTIEFIQWNNGRCEIATPGKNFEEVIELNK